MFIVIGKGIRYIQHQITDFIADRYAVIKITVEKLKRLCSRRRKRSNILKGLKIDLKTGVQRRIIEYLDEEARRAANKFKKLSNFLRIRTPKNRAPPSTLPWIERASIQGPSCKGFIHQLFHFHDFKIWNGWYLRNFKDSDGLRYDPETFIRALILMCKRKMNWYTELHDKLWEHPRLAELCLLKPYDIPDRTMFSRVVDRVGLTPFYLEFYNLAHKCKIQGILPGRIVGVDGSLLESNCRPYKNRFGSYNDPDADIYIRGNYIKGVGYNQFFMTDLEYGLPCCFDIFKGSRNESTMLPPLLEDYYFWYGTYPKTMIADSIMDSSDLDALCEVRGIKLYVTIRDKRKKNLIQIKPGKYIRANRTDIYDIYYPDKLLALRLESERNFSRGKWAYDRVRMPNKGMDNAVAYVAITGITMLLTAYTAMCMGRGDLIRSPTAFSKLKPIL